MDKLKKLIGLSNPPDAGSFASTFVATNDFRNPAQPQFSATSMTTLLATRFDGKAIHASLGGSDAIEEPLTAPSIALLGAGNRRGFVCSKCVANSQGLVGDFAGVPLTCDSVDMSSRLTAESCQNLSLARIKAWAGGERTTVCAVVAHSEKCEIAKLILSMHCVNHVFLSAELASDLAAGRTI